MVEIKIEELRYRPNKYSKEILQGVDASIKEGTFCGILGPNGSGKTTTIRHILAFLQVQSGRIKIQEKELHRIDRKELATTLSFVPQNTFLEADFTVYEVVAMGRNPYMSRFSSLTEKDEKIISEALAMTNTERFREKRLNQLSGGEAQMVLIARAIVQDTPWIILDEPISHLDIKHQFKLMELLKELNEKKHKTIIAILHDINLASQYCDEIILMKDGKVYAKGEADEVLTRENLKAVYEMDFMIRSEEELNHSYYIPIADLEGK